MKAYLLTGTRCDNEYYNGDCHHALVEIDPTTLLQVLTRIGRLKLLAQKEDDQLFAMEYWDPIAQWFPSADGLDQVADLLTGQNAEQQLEKEQPVALAEEPQIDTQIVEAQTCMVHADGVFWQASPKHSGVTVSTHEVSLEVLNKLAVQLGIIPS